MPGGGQGGKGRRRVWGLHTLFRLFTGKWILKTKSPATRHLCLCERPRLQVYLIARVWGPVYVMCVYLYQAPKGLYLRTQHKSFSQVLVCFAPEMWESQMFSRVRIPRTASPDYSSSCPFLTQPRHPVRPGGWEGITKQLCAYTSI